MRKGLALFLVAAGTAVTMSLPAAALEPMQSSELTARIGDGTFEFRGRQMFWRFSPDGKVQSTYNTSRAGQGALGETWGHTDTGTWRRDGDSLCIKWVSKQSEDCYSVVHAQGSMVKLMGPQAIEGTLDSSSGSAYATTPGAPQSAQQHYYYRYQRIPGAR